MLALKRGAGAYETVAVVHRVTKQQHCRGSGREVLGAEENFAKLE